MKQQVLLLSVLSILVHGCTSVKHMATASEAMPPQDIKDVMAKVADWQLANPSKHDLTDWTHGALFAGMTAWAQMADTETYYESLVGFGQKNQWQLGTRLIPYHGDDHCVGQMYIEMYKKYKDPRMIAGTQERFDWILANRPDTPLTHDKGIHKKRWNWCDALFMAPPVWAKLARITGEQKYLDYMNKEWWATTDYLYDPEEHLYFRDDRYFDKREANGEKVFWSRGNGWVFGGLVRVLEELPEDHPDRGRYEALYKEMAAKIKAIQPKEGLWHSSLLDPVSFPTVEASGSGFYCYGLAWGINHGLLDEAEYLPAVMKAWQGLVNCVHPDGKLGNVQPIGADPRQVTADQTEIYGVGAFLLAGSEVYKIAVRNGSDVQQVIVTNPITVFRDSETVGLNWNQVKKTVRGLTKENVAVFDFKANRLLVTQISEGDRSDELLFQIHMAPGEKKYFWVMKQPAGLERPASDTTTYCRFIPERKDDFGWENDKVAFRMYGPALEDETITSGIDAWGKCVSYPVIDKFIKASVEQKIPYHEDHGEGGDFYKVGNTLGCGGMAPFVDNKICLPRNFSEWNIVANGPIRSTFELTYQPWQAGDIKVSETKRISIDLGSHMNRMECRYNSTESDVLAVAAGIVLRDSSKQTWTGDQTIAYWILADGGYGNMGCGVVFGADSPTKTIAADGHLLLALPEKTGDPVVYYAGSCWDKNAELNSFDKWQSYLRNFKQQIDHPVKVLLVD